MKVPSTMRAAAIDRFGGPQVLTLHVLPVPAVDSNEVLIAVHTAGVGSWDADMREGWSPDGRRPRFPLVLGTDGSGTIATVGSLVRRFAPGDAVYAYTFASPKGGFYAEYVCVPANNVGRPPDVLTLKEAGAVTVTGITALQGIDDTLRIKRGEAVVIHGAAGGVGSLALQFAKMRGARVLATATGADGIRFVRRLGADAAADGRREDLAAAARRFAPDGVDAVLALAGGPPLTRLLDAVKRGGRVAYPNGVEPAPRQGDGIRRNARRSRIRAPWTSDRKSAGQGGDCGVVSS
jgi:NADPH:quinone reductase-like Zn-dependent oxidoreductase